MAVSTISPAGRAGVTSMAPFSGCLTVTLYFVFGAGLDGLGAGFSGVGLVKAGGGGQEFYVTAYKK